MACGRCGQQKRGSTALPPGGDTTPARVAEFSPIRYIVNGKKFSTLTAAQDYARAHPGSVIRQS